MNTTQTFLDIGTDPRSLDASSESDGWYTPDWIVDRARQAMGGIDCDPATCAAANAVVQAPTWYTSVENGLIQPWHGRVWCNPPYSAPLPWAQRMVREYEAGAITAGMMLLNCSCSPEWARLLWAKATAVCLLSTRINFWHPSKMNMNNAYDRDSVIFCFTSDPDRFRVAFSDKGIIR